MNYKPKSGFRITICVSILQMVYLNEPETALSAEGMAFILHYNIS